MYQARSYNGQIRISKLYATEIFKNGVALSDIATGGALTLSAIPNFPAQKIDSGIFQVGLHACDIDPTSNSSFDIGSSNAQWKNLYVKDIYRDGRLLSTSASNVTPGNYSMGTFATDVVPVGDQSLGTQIDRWDGLHANNADLSSLSVSDSIQVHSGANFTVFAPVIPGSNAAYDLGSASNTWRSLFVDEMRGSNVTLNGSLDARGIVLRGPLVLGSNSVDVTGSIATSGSRASAMYSSICDAMSLSVGTSLTLRAGSTTSISGNISPGSDDVYDIGSASNRWNNVRATTICASTVSTSNLSVPSGGSALFATSLYPGSNSLYDIGTSSNLWRNVYATNVAIGTGLTTSNLTVNGGVSLPAASIPSAAVASLDGSKITGTLAVGSFGSNSITTTGSLTVASGSISGDLSVNGNINVGGRIDYISMSELLVADKHITLASSSNPSDAAANGAGLYIQGSNYATSNSAISLTWNTGANGNYWLPRGGSLAVQGASAPLMVTLSTDSNGSLKILSDDSTNPTRTAAFGVPLLPASSSLNIGSASNAWGTVFASNVNATQLSCSNLIVSGTTSFVTSSIAASAISGLATIATTGAASKLSGVLSTSNIPGIAASKITSGTFTIGSFGTAITTSNNPISAGTGALSCGDITASGPFSLGLNGAASNAAVGPYIMSAPFDTAASSHTIPPPPGGRNQAGLLHVYAKNLVQTYGGSKAGYMRLYFSSLVGDVQNAFGVIESYGPRISVFSATGSGQNCVITTDSDCCVSYRYEGAV
jgi:hypothetical protein